MFRQVLIRLAFASIAILAQALSAHAQGGHTLEGKVTLPSGAAPQNSVKVTLTFNGRRMHESFTDLSGRFSFAGLGRGTYQITAEGDGQTFETTTVYAEVGAFGSAPQAFTQNIQLRPMSSRPAPPAAVISAEEVDPAIPEQSRKAYQKGKKAASDNQPEKAAKYFLEALAAHPDFYVARAGLADQYGKLKKYDEAMAEYQKAIALRPDRAEAHAGLGAVLVKQKKYSDAIAPLRRSIEIESQSSNAHLMLGLAEMMTGDYKSSEASLLRAYEIGKPTVAHIYLANLYDLRGEPQKAIEHLKAFLNENPDTPDSQQIREVIEKLRKQSAPKK